MGFEEQLTFASLKRAIGQNEGLISKSSMKLSPRNKPSISRGTLGTRFEPIYGIYKNFFS
jgi:hypothetical protein